MQLADLMSSMSSSNDRLVLIVPEVLHKLDWTTTTRAARVPADAYFFAQVAEQLDILQ